MTLPLRSIRYAELAQRTLPGCLHCINPKTGLSRFDKEEGLIWLGTVVYVAGQWTETRGKLPTDLAGSNLIETCRQGLDHWTGESGNLIDRCFLLMGLGLMGPCNKQHPIFASLQPESQARIRELCKVRDRFTNNWECFNASIQGGRHLCFGEPSDLVHPHGEAILSMYKTSGYFDDKPPHGNYNSYGCMAQDFILRVARLLDPQDPARLYLIESFKPSLLRYVELFRHFTTRHGIGWQPGRSAGVLGQIQCLVIIEQALSLGALDEGLARWARRAATELFDFMIAHFWDEERQWLSFHDEDHSCYAYRRNVPMSWDILRYLLQLEHYAREDEALHLQETQPDPFQTEPLHLQICLSPEKNCFWYIWSDGVDRISLPVMGGPGWPSCDTLPKPMCPGLFEGITGTQHPSLSPALHIGDQCFYPAGWPCKSPELVEEDGFQGVRLVYDHLCFEHGGERRPLNGSWETTWLFKSGEARRRDRLNVHQELHHQGLRMEILQPQAYRERTTYPIYKLEVDLLGEASAVKLSDWEPLGSDPFYRNYYSRAAAKCVLQAEKGVWIGKRQWELRFRW